MAFGQINFSHYPQLRNYIDAVEWFESVKPLSKGQYKGLRPFARRGDVFQFMEKNEGTEDIDIYLENAPFKKGRPIISFCKNGDLKIGFNIDARDNFYLDNKICHMVYHIFSHQVNLGWTWGSQPTLYDYRTIEHVADRKYRNKDEVWADLKIYFAPDNRGRWHFNSKGECINAGTGVNWVIDKDKKREITKRYSDFFKRIKDATVLMQMEEGWVHGRTVSNEWNVDSAVKRNEAVIPKLANTNDFKLHSEFITNVLESWGQLGFVDKEPKVIATMLRNIVYKHHAKDFIKEVQIEQYADGSSNSDQMPTRTNYRNKQWTQKI